MNPSVVFDAADTGRWDFVGDAIVKGFDLGTRDKFASTLLHYASGKRASLETVRLILTHGRC